MGNLFDHRAGIVVIIKVDIEEDLAAQTGWMRIQNQVVHHLVVEGEEEEVCQILGNIDVIVVILPNISLLTAPILLLMM